MWLRSVVEVASACSTIVSPGTTFRGDLGNTSITGSVTVEAGEAEDTVEQSYINMYYTSVGLED